MLLITNKKKQKEEMDLFHFLLIVQLMYTSYHYPKYAFNSLLREL